MRTCTLNHGRWMLTCLLLVLATAMGSVLAGPPEKEFGELKKQLNSKINVNFLETPIHAVLGEICNQAGMNLVLPQPNIIKNSGDVTLRMQDATVHRILNIVTEPKDLDWQVKDGVLIVDSSKAIRRQRVIVHIYDLATLIQPIPQFTAKPISLDADSWHDDEMKGGGGGGLFGDASSARDTRAEASGEMLSDIMELLRDSVGDPLDWTDRGGEISSMRNLGSNLIIRTTPEGHAQIKKLLDHLRHQMGRMVAIEMIVANVSSEQIEKVMEANKRSPILNAKLTARLWNALSKETGQRVAVARNVCFNGQRVYLGGVRNRAYVVDMEPVPDATAADPEVNLLREGLSIDVQPTIGSGGDAVTVILRGDVAKTIKMRQSEQIAMREGAFPRIDASGSTSGSVNGRAGEPNDSGEQSIDANISADASLNGKLIPAEGSTLAITEIDLPEQAITQYRTAVDILDGGSVLLTSASRTTVKNREVEQVMLVRVRIIPAHGQKKK